MTLEDAKQEIIKRYKYLYENSFLMLSTFVKNDKDNRLTINVTDEFNSLLEEFLLTDKKMENTTLYKWTEDKKKDKEYLEKIKKIAILLDEHNKGKSYFKTSLDIWKILDVAGNYIENQSGDLNNKERKLKVLDEYYRIARYKNDGRILTSGRNLNLHDCNSLLIPRKKVPIRDKKDVGIKENPFILAISNAPRYEDNNSIFTEKEKQKVYLEYNDELPCDLEIPCSYLEENLSDSETIERPSNTFPCGENFTIKEEEIFVNPSSRHNRYYEVCPNCGFIVNIPSEIIPEKVKEKIEKRCLEDDNLLRKMILYSELLSLDYNSSTNQKRLIKKNK